MRTFFLSLVAAAALSLTGYFGLGATDAVAECYYAGQTGCDDGTNNTDDGMDSDFGVDTGDVTGTQTTITFDFLHMSEDLGVASSAVLNPENGETVTLGEFTRNIESFAFGNADPNCDAECGDSGFGFNSTFSGTLYSAAQDWGGDTGQSGVSLGQAASISEWTGGTMTIGSSD